VIRIIDDGNLAPAIEWPERYSAAQAFLVSMVLVSDEKRDRQRRFIRG
jgi:hypothetical protein